jgi:hypothetical protein
MKTCYYGKVLRKSYGNHGEFYILNTKWFTPRCQDKVKEKVAVGDSIYKPENTWSFYIYKQAHPDSVIFIECDFDCSVYEKYDIE